MRHLAGLLGQGLIVEGPCGEGVKAEVELILPAELKTGLGQGVIPHLGAGVALGQVGGVGGYLVGHQALFHIPLVRQAQMLLGGHIAQHGAAIPADHGGADAGGYMVVARRHIGGEGAEGVERGLVAQGQLLLHILLYQVHGHMAGAFDHGLHIVPPGDFGEFAQGLQLAELGGVVGIGDGAGAQAVAEGEGHIIGLHNLAYLLEAGIEEVLLMMGEAPLGHDGAAAGDDAGDPAGGERHIAQQHAGVDGEVVHPLLGLFDEGVAVDVPGEFLGHAVHLLQGLIDRHGADGQHGVADDPLAGLVDVFAGGEIHHRVGPPQGGPGEFLHLLLDGRGDGGVADVGVHLHQKVAADDHRLQFRVVDVGGDDGPTPRHLIPHELRGYAPGDAGAETLALVLAAGLVVGSVCFSGGFGLHVLAQGDELHLGGDLALSGIVQLGDIAAGAGAAGGAAMLETQMGGAGVRLPGPAEGGTHGGELLAVAALVQPGGAQGGQAPAQVDTGVRVGIGA